MLTGILIIGGMLVLNAVVMPRLIMTGVEHEVPAVTGIDFVQAASILREAGFRVRPGGQEPHPEWAKGVVVRQDPPAGARAKPSRVVTLVVSGGCARVTVPQLAQTGCREALTTLSALGLEVGDIIMVESNRAGVGHVIATMPREGEKLMIGDEVDILVAGPQRPTCYIVPDLMGRPIGDVFKELKQRGIGISKRMYVRGFGGREGTVLSVIPPQGFRICSGESISVAVSSS